MSGVSSRTVSPSAETVRNSRSEETSASLDIGGDEVALLVEAAEDAANAGPEQMRPAARADRVEAELALVERLALAEREQVHLVAVVADEQHRRPDRLLQPLAR